MPYQKMRWSEDVTFNFVKIYLERECLYNIYHPWSKYQTKRNEALKDIIREFKQVSGIDLHMIELRKKIKSLTSTYSQEMKKIEQNNHVPTLKWFQIWHDKHNFRNNRTKRDDSFDDCNKSDMWLLPDSQEHEDSAQSNNQSHNNEDNQIDSDNNHNNDDDPFEHDVENAIFFEVKEEIKTSSCDNKSNSTKKKHRLKRKYSEVSDNNINSSTEMSKGKEDEFDIYGKYIASQLRKMNLTKAIRLQLEIQTMVSEARLSDAPNL